jgi:predicted DNA-binding protein
MKIKSVAPKREKRPTPMSFRLSKEAVKQLKELSKATNKNMTELIEEMIGQAHKDTIKK